MVCRQTTKQLLFESFRELAATISLDDISVNDIVQNCGTSRATFYRYFQDKYDLMTQYYCQQIDCICQKHLFENDDLASMQAEYNAYILQNLNYFRNLSKYDGQNNVFDTIYSYCVNMHIHHAKKYYSNEKLPDDLLFAIQYHALGGISMLKKWLSGEMKLTLEQYNDYFSKCMPNIIKNLYAKSSSSDATDL